LQRYALNIRWIPGIPNISNQTFYSNYNLKPISRILQFRRLKFAGHCNRSFQTAPQPIMDILSWNWEALKSEVLIVIIANCYVLKQAATKFNSKMTRKYWIEITGVNWFRKLLNNHTPIRYMVETIYSCLNIWVRIKLTEGSDMLIYHCLFMLKFVLLCIWSSDCFCCFGKF